MKNVVRSKKVRNYDEENGTKYRNSGTHFPKTTLVSNWKRRNDSSNVNSALKHEYGKHSCFPEELEEVRRKEKAQPVMCCNNCYCRQRGMRPMLSCGPKTCVSKKTDVDQKLQSLSSTRLCEESSSNVNTTFATTVDSDDEFDYTQQRKAYHRYKDVGDDNDDGKPGCLLSSASDDKHLHESVATVYGTNEATASQTPAASSYFTSQASVEDLKAFRNQHYFETHNVEKYAKEIPEHTCTFQFKLNDSLALQPLNTDLYGKSRCTICNVPMKQKQLQQHNPYFDNHRSAMKIRNSALRDKLGLAQKTVGIPEEKAKIELKCSSADVNELRNVFTRYQKPQYFNTFALRQQKMIY